MRRGFLVSAEGNSAAHAVSIVQEENRFAAQAASELHKQKTLAGRRGSAVSSELSQKTEKVFVDARVVSQLGMKGCGELAVLTHGGYPAFMSSKHLHVG